MRYRSPRSIQAYQVVLADSHGIPRAPHYSGTNPEPRHRGTAYTTITHYGRPSQGVRLPRQHGTTPRQRGNRPVPQHPARNGRRLSHARGLAIIRFRSPLLTEYLFLRVLRCFTSPRSPHHPIHVQMMVAQHNPGRVPPFGHPRIKARSPTPRGISQAATSFISSWCQGIHRMPHKTTHNKKHAHDHHHNGRPRGPHAPPRPTHTRKTKQKRGTRADNKDARNHYTNHKQPTTTTTTPAHDQDPAEGPNPTHPHTKTGGGGSTPNRGDHNPHQGRRRAAPQRGGPRVLDVNPTARPSAHSSKAPMPNPTTRTRPTSTLPAEPTRPQAPPHHQPPPPAQSGARGPTARRHHNRAP